MGGLEYLSKETREKAFVLSKNAKGMGISLGRPRFTVGNDYMCYWLTDGLDYVIIFCTPLCYLAEFYADQEGVLTTTYLAVRNIRWFLQWLKRNEFEDANELLHSIDRELSEGEIDLKTYLENLDEDEE